MGISIYDFLKIEFCKRGTPLTKNTEIDDSIIP